MSSLYTKVETLPESLRAALRSVSYGRPDIAIQARETYRPAQPSGTGLRAFCVVVNIATGESELRQGSWGGANMFSASQSNPIDSDRNSYPIPEGIAVIEGHEGGGRPVYASIALHAKNLAPLLPPKSELSERDAYLLTAYKRLTSAGRKNEFERRGKAPSTAELESLVQRNLLAKAGTGLKITTEGKNALAGREDNTL